VRLRRVRTRRFPLELARLAENAVGIAAALIFAVLVLRALHA
jgi:hypothetical protein